VGNLPYSKPYLESSVFISWVKGETTQGPNQDMDAKAICDSIIKAAKAKEFPICTSALTIAEVHKKKHGLELTDGESEDLRPYFREEFIQLIEVDREIGETAHHLCRTHKAGPNQPALRAVDAIHIASAKRAGCDVLLSWDPDLLKQTVDGIRIECPVDISALPPFELKPDK